MCSWNSFSFSLDNKKAARLGSPVSFSSDLYLFCEISFHRPDCPYALMILDYQDKDQKANQDNKE